MVTTVSSWEELPPGTWLENDEHGTHWYLDDEGNRWYSENDAYHMVEVESDASTIEELDGNNNADKESFNDKKSKFPAWSWIWDLRPRSKH